MTSQRISLALAGLLLLMDTGAGAPIVLQPPALMAPKFTQPHDVVKIFFLAVDQGGLVIFDQTLSRSMITPLRVEYTYDLDGPVPVISVYAELITPMAVPNDKDFEVRGVSAILDAEGRIVAAKAHIWKE